MSICVPIFKAKKSLTIKAAMYAKSNIAAITHDRYRMRFFTSFRIPSVLRRTKY